jgi:hypothetical protein
MQTSPVRLILVALLGVLATGAITITAAQAVEAPRWSIAGTDLTEGKTHYITGKKYGPSKVTAGSVTLECEAIKLLEGSLSGSSPGNAGKGSGVIELTKCTVSGKIGGQTIEKCKVNEPIRTNAIKSELVETEKAEPEKEKGSLLVLFSPAAGTSFETVSFTTETGGHCPPATNITGQVAGKVLTDPEDEPELGELVELGQTKKEAKSWLVNFPATPIRKVTRIAGGKASEVATTGLEAFSEEVGMEGTALVSLAKKNTKGEFESETTDWSPLP